MNFRSHQTTQYYTIVGSLPSIYLKHKKVHDKWVDTTVSVSKCNTHRELNHKLIDSPLICPYVYTHKYQSIQCMVYTNIGTLKRYPIQRYKRIKPYIRMYNRKKLIDIWFTHIILINLLYSPINSSWNDYKSLTSTKSTPLVPVR